MKTVFVLGAGFSAEEQFPLVRGLRERVIHFLEAERHSSYETFLRVGDWPEFPKGLFYIGLDEVDPDGTLGFEELLIELRKHAGQGQAPISDRTLRIGVSRLLWCITYFIWRVSGPYEYFARRLAKSQDDVAVISFNWDILIERALTEVAQPWSYSAINAQGFVPVIKPHGSINWSSHGHDPKLAPEYDGWKPIAPGSTLSYDALNPLANPDPQVINPDLQYCLFPGDPDLPTSHPDLARLWSEVEAVVKRSEKVVFIGYSLPIYDVFARNTLASLCASKIVELIDPSKDARRLFLQAIPQAIPFEGTFGQCEYAQRDPAG